ncbi:rhodanese-related sulfurtransferase [Acetobacter estunensis NRIC 0472]|uniref:Rhodanese-related sulfurtransferase n=1 Tax=Acetobacter estunensis TaxID=104097 RepID=A0A967EEH9_9PROT|nr:rhodanese-like domain-containing protein [Acetobacter estunensis]NHO55075.1 rhodanese-related sulfurtransferase [Acetobacter estunensis]GBQ26638.1 rhodanese-related sulfurtransferase [Acetobacter estunensis NRIC 0472]
MNAISPSDAPLTEVSSETVRERLRSGEEIALLDVREEAPFAAGHPLFAVNLPLGRIEERVTGLIPRRTAPIVVYDNGEGRTRAAVGLLRQLGYTNVSVLAGDLDGWSASGGELFIDVNVPSKAFGELVEHVRHTPSLSAEEVHAHIARGDDLVILDARRFVEYNTMSIPGGRSVPGAELALRARDIAPSPDTTVIVNCAGRTRSIIGTQSLVNAAFPNPVFALRNGTIGWTLAGFELDHGATRKSPDPTDENHERARRRARELAEKTGVGNITAEQLRALENETDRTLYRLDVRSPEEYEVDHLVGFRSAPGGQLVQATDEWIGARHGTIVLTDTDGVRARMTGHWLCQLGWKHVYVLDDWEGLKHATGPEPTLLACPLSPVSVLTAAELATELTGATPPLVLDLATSRTFRAGHVPGAFFILPTDLTTHPRVQSARNVVLTSPDGVAAHIAALRLEENGVRTRVLKGGSAEWEAAGRPLASGLTDDNALSAPIDIYKRPYEGTDNAREAMQAYLDWEFGLIAQLERDGTHGFSVLE